MYVRLLYRVALTHVEPCTTSRGRFENTVFYKCSTKKTTERTILDLYQVRDIPVTCYNVVTVTGNAPLLPVDLPLCGTKMCTPMFWALD